MNLREIATEEVEKGTFPAISMLVEKCGKRQFTFHYGRRQIFPVEEPLSPDTSYDLASLTKPLATTLVALNVFEAEGIRFDSPVSRFIPRMRAKEITLESLFTHTSALPPVPDLYREFATEDEIDRARCLAKLFSLVPQAEVGSQVIYSCTGYLLLSRVLEEITGESLSKLFETLIVEPTGLGGIGFSLNENQRTPAATTEYCSWRKRWLKGEVHDKNAWCFQGEGGNAGLFGTLEGVNSLTDLFLQEGYLKDRRILSLDGLFCMTHNMIDDLSPKRSFGFLMQDVDSFAGPCFSPVAFGHTGFTGTSVWIDPEKELKVIILTNRVHLGRDKTAAANNDFRRRIHSHIAKE